ncbi:hypothetical protein HK098_002002 [Nowakowskiella sp. JEL0407]|nr:hypothetical protein HK098_002002 [Nowakowskiella sp. JEL0407]
MGKLFSHIISKIPVEKHDNIKSQIGLSLLSEIDDLENELQVLSEIFMEYHSETEEIFKQRDSQSPIHSSFQRSVLEQKCAKLLLEMNINLAPIPSRLNRNTIDYVLLNNEISIIRKPISMESLSYVPKEQKTMENNQKQSTKFEAEGDFINNIRNVLMEEKSRMLEKINSFHRSLESERNYREKIEKLVKLPFPSDCELQDLLGNLMSCSVANEKPVLLEEKISHFPHPPSSPQKKACLRGVHSPCPELKSYQVLPPLAALNSSAKFERNQPKNDETILIQPTPTSMPPKKSPRKTILKYSNSKPLNNLKGNQPTQLFNVIEGNKS